MTAFHFEMNYPFNMVTTMSQNVSNRRKNHLILSSTFSFRLQKRLQQSPSRSQRTWTLLEYSWISHSSQLSPSPSALKKFAAPVTCQASGYFLSVLYCSFILWLIKAQRGPRPYLHSAGGRVLICTGTEHDRNWGVQCHKMTFLTWHPP